jgi:superfamily II DNA/RNA helicase
MRWSLVNVAYDTAPATPGDLVSTVNTFGVEVCAIRDNPERIMPKSNKSGGFKAAKNYEPRTPGKGGPKAGSRSPGHRGYKAADESAPRKQRWNADDRAARTERPAYGDRPERGGYSRGERSERPSYGDRPERGGYNRGERSERPSYGDRPERGGYNRGERSERPSYGDRPERGGYNRGERSERPAYGDRPERGGYQRPNRENGFNKSGTGTERPAYNRDERPAYNRDERHSYSRDERRVPQRTDRQKWNDARNEERRAEAAKAREDAPKLTGRTERPARAERPAYNDRPARSFDDRPKRSFDRDDRPKRSFDRDDRPKRSFDRDDRPARAERPAYNDRPARTERPASNDRPARSFDDPPKRSFDRDDRPKRSFDRDSRPERTDRGSDFYPKRDSKPAFNQVDDVVLERLEAQATVAGDVDGVTFADLGIGGNIVRVLSELGAESPFPIQAATIPMVLEGRDVLGRGRTGSGKTIAFGAPLVERLMENGGGANRKPGRKPRALILAPTRELALQIDRTVQPIARAVGLFTTQIYGGVPQARQVGALQRGVDIIIGTPGRIEDLIEQRRLDLSEVTITVLDEADHMCDLGFLEPVQRILRHTRAGGQKLLFSATLDKGVATLVDEFLVEPSVHEVAGEDQASSTIDHRVLVVESRDKSEIIKQLADREGKTLIFSRTRAYAEMLAEQLEDAGFPATSLHGDLNQSRRTRNLQQLTSGRVNVLVATDVAARGIHVDDIDLVIQADAPDEYKTYLHRAGRTGRAGKKGTVVTLIPRARRRRMDELLERAEIEAEMVDAFPGDALLGELAADTPVAPR